MGVYRDDLPGILLQIVEPLLWVLLHWKWGLSSCKES